MPMDLLHTTSLLLFTEGGVSFALPTARVHSILEPQPITAIPKPRTGVLGFFRIEKQLVPLVNLSIILGIPIQEARYFIVTQQIDRLIAFPVNHVETVTQVPVDELSHPRGTDYRIPVQFIQAIGGEDQSLLVLRTASLLTYLNSNSASSGVVS